MIEPAEDDFTHYFNATGRLSRDLASAHRRIRHLRARAAYWRAQATGYGDSKSEREGRRKR